MPDTIVAFPQHRAGKPKPTFDEIVKDGLKAGLTSSAILQTVGALCSKMTMEEHRAFTEGRSRQPTRQ
jgi:hypothetical protein